MSTKNLGDIAKKVYDLLFELEDSEKEKVLNSITILLNVQSAIATSDEVSAVKSKGVVKSEEEHLSAKDYFNQKDPQNRGELLACAARFLEIRDNKESVSKSDLESIFREARRNFDSSNFTRDIQNAIHNGKLFLRGNEPNTFKLSFYGLEFIDKLPDRAATKAFKRPSSSLKKKSKSRAKDNQ